MLFREESDLGRISFDGQISPCLNAGKIRGHRSRAISISQLFFTTVEYGRCSIFICDLWVSFKDLKKGAYQ